MEPASFRLIVQCINQLHLRVLEEKKLIFAEIYLINVANLPKFSIVTLTIMTATARPYSAQQAACWYRLLTADQGIGCDSSICFGVTSGVLPPEEHKINKRTCNV